MLPSQSPQNQWSSHTSSPLWTHHYVILCYIMQVKTESAIRELWKIFFVLNQPQRNKPESNKAKKATLTAVMCKEIFLIQWDFVLWVITDKSLSEYCIEITYFYPFSLNTGLILSRFSDCHFPQKSWRKSIQSTRVLGEDPPLPFEECFSKNSSEALNKVPVENVQLCFLCKHSVTQRVRGPVRKFFSGI